MPSVAGKTRIVRLPEDLAEMCRWVADFEQTSMADILDPLVRPSLEERYARIASRVETIKAARLGEPLPGQDPELGEAGA